MDWRVWSFQVRVSLDYLRVELWLRSLLKSIFWKKKENHILLSYKSRTYHAKEEKNFGRVWWISDIEAHRKLKPSNTVSGVKCKYGWSLARY